MPKADMGVILALNSCQDVREAPSYSKGGRKIRKTISGSMLKSGKIGTNPIINPTNTRSTGYGIFSLSIIADKLINTAIIKITILKFSIVNASNLTRNSQDRTHLMSYY